MKWTIRDAHGGLAELRSVYRRSALSNAGDPQLLLATPEVLELTAASSAAGRTRTAMVGDHVVGFATSSVHDGWLELDALFVDPGWMRRGVGRDLLADTVAVALAAGLDRIEVTANDHALPFYERAGFEAIGSVDTPLVVPAPRLRRHVPG